MTKKKSYIIIAAIGIVSMLLWGMSKEGYHPDEVFSYLLSNNYFEGTKFTGETGWHSPAYYLNMVTVPEGGPFDLKSVIYNQANDVHPPLYYIFFHFVSWVFSGVFSKWIGLSLNLVFGILVGFLLYEVSMLFTENQAISTIISLFYILSNGAASNYLFLRMYLLLTVFQVLLTYFLVKLLKDGWSKRYMALYGTTILLGGLTHYYFYFYAFFLTLFACLYLFFSRKIKKSFIFGSSALGFVLITFLIYPWALDHVFNSGRGEGVREELSAAALDTEAFQIFTEIVSEQLFAGFLNHLLIIIAIGAIIIAVKKAVETNKIKISKMTWIYIVVLLSTVSTMYLIAQVSPYKISRYVYAIYPLIVLLVLVALYKIMTVWLTEKRTNLILFVLASAITIIGLMNHNPDHTYAEMAKNREALAETGADKAFIMSYEPYQEAAQIKELIHFSEIYRLSDFDRAALPDDEMLWEEPIIIYIEHARVDGESFREKLKETYNIDQLDFLYRHSYHNVYVAN